MSGVVDLTTRLVLDYDILLLIFEQLELDEAETTIRTAISNPTSVAPETQLTHAATVCKSFFAPAMDIKWRKLGSLFPLLKVIPNFVKKGGAYVSAPV